MNLRLARHLDRYCESGGILAYHGVADDVLHPSMHVTPSHLRRQLVHLRERYRVLRLTELLERIERGQTIAGCIALTFDDAYVGVAEHAHPLLRELDLPATVFVTSGAAQTGAPYWWDEVEHARSHGSDEEWSATLRRLGLPALARATSADVVRTRVLARFAGRFPDAASPAATLRLATALDASMAIAGAGRRSCAAELRSLDFAALGELATDERIDFGCHTVTHPALPFLSAAEQEREMVECQATLAGRLPRVQPIVAYPYGLYDDTTIRAARRAGMRAGLSIEGLPPSRRQHLMTVPRVGLGESTALDAIGPRLTFRLRPLLVLRHGGAHPRMPMDRLRLSAPAGGQASA